MKKTLLLAGTVFAFLSVALGAFGAHALKHSLDAHQLEVFRTAVTYQQIHALALILVGLLYSQQADNNWIKAAGLSIIIGVILFSGSLYLLSVFSLTGFGIITPIGGLAFLIGWFCLAVSIFRYT